jgi:chromosome segregation ATPase
MTGEMKKDSTSKHKVIKNLPEENMVIMESPRRESLEDKYEKEHKLRQEAEGELSIMKGIETNRVKEAQARCDYLQNEFKTHLEEAERTIKNLEVRSSSLQDELDRTKKENNDLFNRIAELTEVEEYHRKLNGKLQQRLTEVEEDNKKLANQIEDKINQLRRSGM